jgi:hypothetical protein
VTFRISIRTGEKPGISSATRLPKPSRNDTADRLDTGLSIPVVGVGAALAQGATAASTALGFDIAVALRIAVSGERFSDAPPMDSQAADRAAMLHARRSDKSALTTSDSLGAVGDTPKTTGK